MKNARLWAPLQTIGSATAVVALSFGCLLAQSADAQGTAKPFLKDQYYLGSGNTPPTLEEFAVDPMAYLRSEAAYVALRQRFADTLGKASLSESEFLDLFKNGRVRDTTPCRGSINTDGILPSESIVSNTRNCYTDEMLIELLVGTRWVMVASQGCYNSSRHVAPSKPKEKEKVCRWVHFSDGHAQGTHVHADGTVHQNCCCSQHAFSTPGYTGFVPNTLKSKGGYQVCN